MRGAVMRVYFWSVLGDFDSESQDMSLIFAIIARKSWPFFAWHEYRSIDSRIICMNCPR